MAYKFQIGQAIMSGALDQEGDVDILDSGVLKVAGSTAIDASRNASLAVISGSSLFVTDRISGSNTVDVRKDKLTISGVAMTATAAELNILDGVTATTSELNILDGVTATATELNLLDGVTATTTELNHLDGSSANLATFALPASTTISAYGASLVNDLSASEARTTLGLGSMATQAHGSVNIDGGAIDGTVIGGAATADASVANFVAASAKISDLSANRVVFCNNDDGELVDSDALTFDGADLVVSGRLVASGAGDISGSGDLSVAGVSGSLEFAVTHAANSGIVFSGAYNNTAARTVSFDLSQLSNSMLDGDMVGADTIAIYDSTNSAQKKATLTELAEKLAGAGLSAANGVISAASSTAVNEFTATGNLAEGYNIQTNDADVVMTMPAGDNVAAGDIVTVKAGPLTGGNMVTINKHGTHAKQIDGLDTIRLESPFAAVTMIYSSDSQGWKII